MKIILSFHLTDGSILRSVLAEWKKTQCARRSVLLGFFRCGAAKYESLNYQTEEIFLLTCILFTKKTRLSAPSSLSSIDAFSLKPFRILQKVLLVEYTYKTWQQYFSVHFCLFSLD